MVRSGREPMWKRTVSMSGVTNVGDAVYTLDGRCALKSSRTASMSTNSKRIYTKSLYGLTTVRYDTYIVSHK